MRRWWVLGMMLALGLVVVLTGCRRRGLARDARLAARYEERVARTAARDSNCPAHQVQPVRVAEQIWVVNTCTGPREYFLQCRRPGSLRGCRWRRVPTVNEAAAQYLQCPPQAVQQQVGQNPMLRGAAGCGRQLMVGLQCNPTGCNWAPMGPPAAAAPAGPPAGPPPGQAPAAPPGYGGTAQGSVVVVPAN